MSSVLAAGRRHLPRGWADFARQIAIWFGFLAVYQIARGLADRHPARAFANGDWVVNFETHFTHRLYELTLQQFVDQRGWLEKLVSWTYWNSEFTVLGIALLWVYFRRHEYFLRFRNSVLLANVLGLFGYVFMPTAPPRLLGVGFVNAHTDGLVQLAANPYAAMPSLHAADSLIVGVVLALVVRHWWAKVFWCIWPAWVWFVVMASGNHFWLDCLAGVGVALISMGAVFGRDLHRALAVRRA
ncbi:MAG: phosphatase PAP2 family protein [Actinobacteria bacterium]|nr:phosphatase PAP2 family protein [Actinomycetota bacterium]MBV8395963.1 phosphatase PAP2 family protein [Actinomycetota bacterium]